ncbi:MAG: hypothetical protein WAU65_02140 [Candidatus Nanoarchaeia archaeon]
MVDLEEDLRETLIDSYRVKVRNETGKTETGYEGLELIEEHIHSGGTSVKYWM